MRIQRRPLELKCKEKRSMEQPTRLFSQAPEGIKKREKLERNKKVRLCANRRDSNIFIHQSL
jgi:hypothetical protein